MRLGRSLAVALAAGAVVAAPDPSAARRLESVQGEIARLRAESLGLVGRERGLLGEVLRMDAAIALHRAELTAATMRLEATEAELGARERVLTALESAQARRAPHLARSLRALYTRGTVGLLETLLGAWQSAGRLDGIRYAGFLARRDAAQITTWRRSVRRIRDERDALRAEQVAFSAAREEAARTSASLDRARREREAAIRRIRGDRQRYDRAIEELEAAASELSRVIEGTTVEAAAPAVDVRAFRGLLDWPTEGPVSAGFGPTIHPRFKTAVPHPGLDIDAAEGSTFRSVFDGRVAYAASLHGYGLTVVIDHGSGIVSIYAHASVLLVGPGDAVVRGQDLGRVGESGSLRGAYLYFELREGGKPVDPAGWLRRR